VSDRCEHDRSEDRKLDTRLPARSTCWSRSAGAITHDARSTAAITHDARSTGVITHVDALVAVAKERLHRAAHRDRLTG
jgi:hypothetical protein